ncbi:exonuclease domain-containing protein (plasmid) [Aneurinibacillus sp. Ricciae_BoGa-3]|uniref:3'-5' exonuclease n=1 Tax=Aneurinibacillus sp. Ricciae_BoGa-3 TaxID=3022697 RepID=UPI00233F7E6B|nr:3'-5' exonuclease [Aneurinibacillus sp. Ricciae_BoGa-3]WCK57004.1 exonuclease domain-containing protein [Aneurinibacillus sp. Ricciae_BoGa-3]
MTRTYIVFDLEATCDKNKTIENEIIEIGAVKVNERGELVDTFQRFVKPILNPVLTDFCKNLTKIRQEDVDSAKGFPDVIQVFREWIGTDYILCSWGFYDKKQIKEESLLHRLDSKWAESHISLKHQYKKIRNLERPIGTGAALKKEGFTFDGTPHRGIDDAKNIAKIFVKYLERWDFGK